MDENALDATVTACRDLITTRFPAGDERGAAAMLLGDGTIVTGTSPDDLNPSVSGCHEVEPYCAAFRLAQPVAASVCLHRDAEGGFRVLSPCGVCRERLAAHGPGTLVAVPADGDQAAVRWLPLRDLLPHYWLTAFPDEVPAWTA